MKKILMTLLIAIAITLGGCMTPYIYEDEEAPVVIYLPRPDYFPVYQNQYNPYRYWNNYYYIEKSHHRYYHKHVVVHKKHKH